MARFHMTGISSTGQERPSRRKMTAGGSVKGGLHHLETLARPHRLPFQRGVVCGFVVPGDHCPNLRINGIRHVERLI
jgi:hypothetical protein